MSLLFVSFHVLIFHLQKKPQNPKLGRLTYRDVSANPWAALLGGPACQILQATEFMIFGQTYRCVFKTFISGEKGIGVLEAVMYHCFPNSSFSSTRKLCFSVEQEWI